MAILDNILLSYNMNDASGAIVDATGTSNGTNNGASYGATGKVGDCLDFEESQGDYVLTNDSAFDETSNWTFSCWAKLESFTQDGTLLSTDDDNSDSPRGIIIHVESTSSNPITVQGSSVFATGGSMSTGTFTMITVTYDGTNLEIWKDNVSQGTTAWTPDGTSGNQVYIGSRTGNAKDFDGLIDEWNLWQRKLTDAEIQTTLWNGGDGTTYPFVTDITISPSAFTLSTSQLSPSLFIDITQGISLSANLGLPFIDMPLEQNRGTVGTQEIATRFPVEEGLIARTTKQTVNPNLEAREEGAF